MVERLSTTNDGGWQIGVGGRIGAAGIAAVVTALVLWLAAYGVGIVPWLGYAAISSSSIGIGPVSVIGGNRTGTDIGPHQFLFFAGQQIVIDYDVTVRAGSLWLHVYRPFDGTLGKGPSRSLTESGKGEWTVPVTQTGIYHITIEPMPALHRDAARGWDLTYTAWWGARR